jgi:hypothetical protein
MNTRPTPETDKFFATFADGEYAPSHAEYYARLQDLERERDELRRWTSVNGVIELQRELAEARGQRDSLAEALRECREDRGKCNMCSPCEQQHKYEN